MHGADDNVSEVRDTGERWLTFFVISGLAVIAIMIALSAVVSFYWAMAGAVPVGIAIGWIASGICLMRRAISAIVDVLAYLVSAFS